MPTFLSNFYIKKEQEDFGDIMTNIQDNIEFKGTNLWVLIFAIFIASLGLNLNSIPVVIGAMLISPLMWPIMGIGVSMAIYDSVMLRKSLRETAFAVGISLIASTIYFLLTPLSDAQSEILARTSPTIYDVLIALFGWLAGIIAVSSTKKWNVIPGVAIATALIPPLCTAGYWLATWQLEYFFGAFYLFLINTVFIAISSLIVAKLLKFPYKEFPDPNEKKRSKQIIWAVILIAIIPSIYFGYDIVAQTRFTNQANKFVEIEWNFSGDYLLKKIIDPKTKTITLIYGGEVITNEQIIIARSRLSIYEIADATLDIKQGFASLYESAPKINAGISLNQGKIDELTESLREEEQKIRAFEESKKQSDDENKAIFDEISIISPKIANISIANNMRYSAGGSSDISIVFIGLKVNLDTSESNMIHAWLKKRLQSENIEIIEQIIK